MKEIDIYDGNYTVVMNERGTIDHILRHHVRWRAGDEAYTLSGFVFALVQEIIKLRKSNLAFSDQAAWDGLPEHDDDDYD